MENEMPIVPTVSSTMMQATSLVLSGIASTLRRKRSLHGFAFRFAGFIGLVGREGMGACPDGVS